MISIKMPNPDKLFDGLDKRSLQLVKVRAQNKLVDKLKTRANRAARESQTVKADALRNTMRVTRANLHDPAAYLFVKGTRPALSKFQISPAKPNPQSRRRSIGTKSRELRSSPLAPRAHAFTARMPSGHIGVFMRVEGKTMTSKSRYFAKNPKRQMIREITGTSAPGMVNAPRVMAQLRQLIHDESEVIYKRELAYALGTASATVTIG